MSCCELRVGWLGLKGGGGVLSLFSYLDLHPHRPNVVRQFVVVEGRGGGGGGGEGIVLFHEFSVAESHSSEETAVLGLGEWVGGWAGGWTEEGGGR